MLSFELFDFCLIGNMKADKIDADFSVWVTNHFTQIHALAIFTYLQSIL